LHKKSTVKVEKKKVVQNEDGSLIQCPWTVLGFLTV